MPLVRISLLRGNADGRKVGEVVNFQVVTEHEPGALIYDPGYLDIARTDGFVAIQITLNERRSVEMKKAWPRDVFLSLVEVKKENWSFGNGIGQYAQ